MIAGFAFTVFALISVILVNIIKLMNIHYMARKMHSSQEALGEDFEKVLHNNLWELYEK